ncbi:capsule biosynthesis protein [Sphaerotilus uruguayifluvii]|uniref:Capsule polysaccharide modification protein KpsS n=1 Tax=Sphaerotilus uruguayifluvii TaxID=2735897 RepID=A0ABX2G4Z3_9BURK|nr:capsular biosynthesis protein [Leptothrix sp. C29]NRT57119.1 capsule polysaccharide modification protein KpsS [Leptothrix sp. C29]
MSAPPVPMPPAPEPEAPFWPTAFRALARHRRTLMLQGPIGWFFDHLAAVLRSQGQTVTKVHFNGGDQTFWRHPGALRFDEGIETLDAWLRMLIRSRHIDAIVLFGQMRPVHCIARQVARELGIEVFVFEEGYLRPDHVTIERRGVNALSRLPRAASFYEQRLPEATLAPLPPPVPTGQKMHRTALLAMRYYLAATLLHPRYPHRVHHRSLEPVGEGLRWFAGALRKPLQAWRERGLQDRLCSPAMSRRWFLVPLQVHDDSQIRHHSRFAGMHDFIEEVMRSFAADAPGELHLAIKHHPMDIAYSDHRPLIRHLTRQLGLHGRVHCLHDQHLPTLLDHALGVVTVNSTVGLQALHHGAPVLTLGEAVYGIPGLVHDGPLPHFWNEPGRVDKALYRSFRRHLIEHTQLNASFYARMPALEQAPAPAPASPRPAGPSPLVQAFDTGYRLDEFGGRP